MHCSTIMISFASGESESAPKPGRNRVRAHFLGRPAKTFHQRALQSIAGFLLTSGIASAAWQPERIPSAQPSLNAPLLYYRCFFRVPDNMTSRAAVDLWTDSALFSFADLPGRFTVFLNGQKIADGDSLPPEPRRRFKITKGILEKKAFNALALRLEGDAARRGLRVAPILHGYHDEMVLEGTWEVASDEPAADDLRAVTNQPPRAYFTEANFSEASTALAPNAELVRGQRLQPAESLTKMRTPDDLTVELILHEPQRDQ